MDLVVAENSADMDKDKDINKDKDRDRDNNQPNEETPMRSQQFRKPVPISLLRQYLEQSAIRYGDDYELNERLYMRDQKNGHNSQFLESLRPYYYPSKQRVYLDRDPSYNAFITVVRQLCKYHRLPYRYAIVYEQSKYSIHHYIRF
jgi:hypothetical protein